MIEVVPAGPAEAEALAAWLATRAAETLFLASNLERYGIEDRGGFYQGRWLVAWRGGRPCGATQLVNQGSVLLAGAPDGTAEALAEAAVATGFRPLRLMGMRPEVEAFASVWDRHRELAVREIRDSELMGLPASRFEGGEAPGFRAAGMGDLEWLLPWKRRFRIEGLGDDPSWVDAAALREAAELAIREGRQFLVEDQGRPVSMGLVNAVTRNAAQLGGVFTPGEFRGHGHGSRMVLGLCRHFLRDQGLSTMALAVDPGKTSATRIYTRLGFAPLGCFRFQLLEP